MKCAALILLSLLTLLWHLDASHAHWHDRIFIEDGEKEGSEIYHVGDGLFYHFNRGDNEKTYFICVKNKTLGCCGRAIYHAHRGFRHSQGHEGHKPNRRHAQVLRLRRQILNRCRTLENTSFTRILNQERARFPAQVGALVTMSRMRSPMRDARLSNYPPIPPTLRELTDLLRDPQYQVITMTDDGADNLFRGSVTDANGDHHMIFASRRMIDLMSGMDILFADGMHSIVPSIHSLQNRRSQVFSISTSWRNHTIPLVWILMEGRTQAAYEAVFSFLRNLRRTWNFQRVIADEEAAQINAWHSIFDPPTLQNCLWHICRAFVLEIGSLGLGGWFHNQEVPQFRFIVRMACALPLLPAALLRLGWNVVRRESRDIGGIFLRNLMEPFFHYLWINWVSSARRRRHMSCYRSRHRTNNIAESLNSRMQRSIGVHTDIWHFIDGFLEMEFKAFIDVGSLMRGLNPSQRRTTRAIVNDEIINNLYDELENPPMGINDAVRRFLLEAAGRVERMMNLHIPRNP